VSSGQIKFLVSLWSKTKFKLVN